MGGSSEARTLCSTNGCECMKLRCTSMSLTISNGNIVKRFIFAALGSSAARHT